MKRLALVTAALLALVGCAGARPITDSAAQGLRGKRVVSVVPESANFVAMSPDKAMFAVIGAIAAATTGNALVKDNEVADPAVKLSADLGAALTVRYGVSVATAIDPKEAGDLDALAARYPDHDLLLQVQTTGWGVLYFPLDWTHYRVQYALQVSLVDLRTREVIARGSASRVPDKTPNAPTWDELMASEAARLKTELQALADQCYGELSRDIFKL